MTDDLLHRLRTATEGVTEGPWREFVDDTGGRWSGWPMSVDCTAITDKTIVRTGGMWPYEWDAQTSQAEAVANARFIAAARTLIPEAAAEISRLQARIAELEGRNE